MTHTPTLRVAENGNLRIHIPMRLKRLAGRKQVIAPEGLDGAIPDATDPAQSSVVQALARAHAWTTLLDTDRYPSISALARDLKLDCSYVRRILLLTTLAPDIVEAFLNGIVIGIVGKGSRTAEVFAKIIVIDVNGIAA